MNNFIDLFVRTAGNPTNVFSLTDALLVMVLACILSMIVAYVYKKTHSGISYSQSFVITLVLLGLIVSTIMLIIGSNIARAFTLVGALSIIRFRNAIKDTRDVGFIFWVMAVGMACGTRFYMLGVLFTLFTSLVVFILTAINFGAKEVSEQIVKIIIPEKFDYKKELTPLFTQFFKEYNLLSIQRYAKEKEMELVFLTQFNSKAKKEDFIEQVQKKTKDKSVTILESEHTVHI